MTETEPEATPKSSARMAPNSSDISRTSSPCGLRRMAKKPPPPRKATARVNGRSRVQNENPTVTDLPRKGMRVSAPSDRLVSEKTPMATLGRPMVKPAVTPSAETSRKGGSLKPSSGISFFKVSMKERKPTNSRPLKTTSTSGLRFEPPRKARRSKPARTSGHPA